MAPQSPSSSANSTPRVTVPSLRERKCSQGAAPIVCITAYDATFARLFDEAEVDLMLVGDSVASVVQGLENTIPVTLDEMLYHCRCVTRVVRRALVVGDMPFMSYQISPAQALESAGRFLKEGGVSAVKLEGGLAVAETVRRLVEVDIPVVGHVGLTPQSFHRMGGHKIQGKRRGSTAEVGSAERIIADAKAIAEAGAFMLVIEGVPNEIAQEITAALDIPTIGIGAGKACDGQILVSSDLLGLNPHFSPRFVKRFAELGEAAKQAVKSYGAEVRSGMFPGPEHSLSLPQEKRASGAPTRSKVSKLKIMRA